MSGQAPVQHTLSHCVPVSMYMYSCAGLGTIPYRGLRDTSHARSRPLSRYSSCDNVSRAVKAGGTSKGWLSVSGLTLADPPAARLAVPVWGAHRWPANTLPPSLSIRVPASFPSKSPVFRLHSASATRGSRVASQPPGWSLLHERWALIAFDRVEDLWAHRQW